MKKILLPFIVIAILISSCSGSRQNIPTQSNDSPTETNLTNKDSKQVSIISTELATTITPSELPAKLDLPIAGDAPLDYEWSPDGSSLLLGAQNSGSFLINISPDLKKWSILDTGDSGYQQTGLRPSWSADGNWIVYCKATGTRPVSTNTNSATGIKQASQRGLASGIKGPGAYLPIYDVFKIQKDGSGIQQITQLEADFCQAKWSSDGKSIAVFWSKDKVNHLGIKPIDGSLQEIVPEINPGVGSWSPDGTTLAITGISNTTEGNKLYIVKPDGNSIRQIPGIIGVIGAPEWSGDGKSIVYMKEDGIYITDVSGGNHQKLTEGMLYDCQSVLSLDGELITFSSDRTGEYQVYIIRIDGTGLFTYQDSGLNDMNPIWSRDGKRLTFFSHQSNTGGNIVIVPLSMFTPV